MMQTNRASLRSRTAQGIGRGAAACGLALALAAGCSSTPGGRAFATPDEAADAFAASLRSDDPAELGAILGPEADDLIGSGDAVADAQTRGEFLEAYDRAHRIELEGDTSATLLVGEQDWPLPIPLVKDGDVWRFDAEAGVEEIHARRIGANELNAIEVCRAIVDAQQEYFENDPELTGGRSYAQRFISRPNRQDGLYWDARLGLPASPLGPLVAEATAEGYSAQRAAPQQPFHGYCYRMLEAQGPSAPGGSRSYMSGGRMTGGFAVVAWPAVYDRSGVMTFQVSQAGIVFQKDLGEETESAVEAIQAFDPGEGWDVVP